MFFGYVPRLSSDRRGTFKHTKTIKMENLFENFVTFHIEPGNVVLCDDCNADYTDSDESGGILFGSRAICPKCQQKWIENARKYNEEKYIKARCPKDMSFADWVRDYLR